MNNYVTFPKRDFEKSVTFMSERLIYSEIERTKNEMVTALAEMIKIKAISPKAGGEGEYDRAEHLMELIEKFGFDKVQRYDAPDEHAKKGIRPNIVAILNGKSNKKLWIISHIDTVPEGDASLWNTDPFMPVIKDNKIYGRGTEDNGQAVIASLYAIGILKKLNIEPEYTVGLAFVSDEETGSKYGVNYLLEQKIFHKNDLILVPDHGEKDGLFIEVAEKSVLWLKITTHGKQVHASTPEEGINAHRYAMNFALELDKLLHSEFNDKDDLFKPPYSTFEPTKKEPNVANVNTIPGKDVIYFDNRVLPHYNLDDIISFANELTKEYPDVQIEIEPIEKNQAPPGTDPNSEIVQLLKKVLKKIKGKEPHVGGIGGSTCAAEFRERGYSAAVWETIDRMAHQPNEYAVIDNLIEDAKVFALMATTPIEAEKKGENK